MFVASYLVLQDKKSGSFRSYSIWADDVLSLLPQSDLVIFMLMSVSRDSTVLANADWEYVCAKFGEWMKQTPRLSVALLSRELPQRERITTSGERRSHVG